MRRRKPCRTRSIHRASWLITTATLHVVGLVAATSAPRHDLAEQFVAFALAGLVVALLTHVSGKQPTLRSYARNAALRAGFAGVSGIAILGLLRILGGIALLLVLVVVATSPGVVAAFRRRAWTGFRTPSTNLDRIAWTLACSSAGAGSFQPRYDAPRVTDEDLCDAWLASLEALRTATSGRKRLQIVEARENLLNRLEARNPAAFSAWLASGGTPAGSPLPYMKQTCTDRCTIDWDGLTGGT